MTVAPSPPGVAPRIPLSTYRIQFHAGFRFADALALADYLADLGIGDLYASPLLMARRGSLHGYDISDHSRLNPELGDEEDFRRLSDALRRRDLGLLLDMVPNHMGIGEETNRWWMDVLEHGPASIHADYFDIDWHPAKAELADKILLPVLEDQYGVVLEDGKLQLAYDTDRAAFVLRYHDYLLPVAPRSWDAILKAVDEACAPPPAGAADDEDETLRELRSIRSAARHLPPRSAAAPAQIQERYRESDVIRRRLLRLHRDSPRLRDALDRALGWLNGRPGEPASFDPLDRLIAEQAYRLAFWRVATDQINYRRFFDINDLAALRTERAEVFKATHRLVLRLIAEGHVSGLRIDHPDGLRNPRKYFRDLQAHALAARRGVCDDRARADIDRILAPYDPEYDAERPADGPPFYVVAEKILTEGEPLPREWAIHGTVGYDFLNQTTALFVDSRREAAFDRLYARFTGQALDFAELAYRNRLAIMEGSLASEINALARRIERIAERHRRFRDFTLNNFIFALREIIACFAIYRTYIESARQAVLTHDRAYIERAVAEARRRNFITGSTIFDFLRETLLLQNADAFAEADRPALTDFLLRFQQLTGPVMAKGLEDTAFYVFNRLVSLNEVGGDPRRFGHSVDAFHQASLARRRDWPHAMLAGTTHDTKRSEDARARINLLSEIPGLWRKALGRWSRMNARAKRTIATYHDREAPAPSRNDEYLLYQALIATWPLQPMDDAALADYRRRIGEYMRKATREAKEHTSWINPNDDYDEAVQQFVAEILRAGRRNFFLTHLEKFQRPLAALGAVNALSQTLLKLTSPGVPDIFQGDELWNFCLVDPDNRRPVDFVLRRHLLADLRRRIAGVEFNLAPLADELLGAWRDGRIKLYVTHRLLQLRRQAPALFRDGEYLPLTVHGDRADHVCAFLRRREQDELLVIVPRLLVGLCGFPADADPPWPVGESIWRDTWIDLPERPAAPWKNLFTDETPPLSPDHALKLADALFRFPVAAFVRSPQT